VVDFATSRWAAGKVRVAMNKGMPVPPDTLLDSAGRPTRDPSALFADPPGALLTFGEHKGWGLALACELLAGALTGGQVQTGSSNDGAIINSMLSVIVSPDRIGTSAWSDSVERVVAWVQSEHVDESPVVRLPADPEQENKRIRLRDGIPVDGTTWREIVAAAVAVGLAPSDLSEPGETPEPFSS
jgi:uncharacterized oxidoreductase